MIVATDGAVRNLIIVSSPLFSCDSCRGIARDRGYCCDLGKANLKPAILQFANAARALITKVVPETFSYSGVVPRRICRLICVLALIINEPRYLAARSTALSLGIGLIVVGHRLVSAFELVGSATDTHEDSDNSQTVKMRLACENMQQWGEGSVQHVPEAFNNPTAIVDFVDGDV